MVTLHQLLKGMIEQDASDLHISSGAPPLFRIYGKMVRVKADTLSSASTKDLCYSILTDYQKAILEENKELDLSFGVKNLARFRANIFYQRGSIAGVFRRVPYEVLTPEEIGLSPVVINWVHKPKGLILVTGPTGSGKSTTLAALIHAINSNKHLHIVTIEDPVEFTHVHGKCLVTQREIGPDTHGFTNALRSVLRQDPDVILIGEMRDLETMNAALTVAETGHLVFATLHTNGTLQTITRIIQTFPAEQQDQVRTQLSFVLEGVISQTLVQRQDGEGRVLAHEVLVLTPAIRNLVRENKLHQIYGQMQVGQEEHGMQTMNQSLISLIQRNVITPDAAMEHTFFPEELDKMIQELGMKVSTVVRKKRE